MKNHGVIIRSVGKYLPDNIVTNEVICAELGPEAKTPEWILKKTGVEQRRFEVPIRNGTAIDKNFSEVSFGERAAREALDRAELTAAEIDGLWYVSCTQRNEEYFSVLATGLHHRLNMREDSFALELNSGCGGLIQAIGVSHDMINGNNSRKNFLIVTSNLTSRNFDRRVYIPSGAWLSAELFGDAGGAFVLQKKGIQSSDRGILGIFYAADGCDPLMERPTWSLGSESVSYYKIRGTAVKERFPILMLRALQGLQKKIKFDLKEVSRFYFHQANLRLLEMLVRQLNISLEKVAININKLGNTSAVSTLLLYEEDLTKGRIRNGDLLLFLAVGAGAHLGAFLYRQ